MYKFAFVRGNNADKDDRYLALESGMALNEPTQKCYYAYDSAKTTFITKVGASALSIILMTLLFMEAVRNSLYYTRIDVFEMQPYVEITKDSLRLIVPDQKVQIVSSAFSFGTFTIGALVDVMYEDDENTRFSIIDPHFSDFETFFGFNQQSISKVVSNAETQFLHEDHMHAHEWVTDICQNYGEIKLETTIKLFRKHEQKEYSNNEWHSEEPVDIQQYIFKAKCVIQE